VLSLHTVVVGRNFNLHSVDHKLQVFLRTSLRIDVLAGIPDHDLLFDLPLSLVIFPCCIIITIGLIILLVVGIGILVGLRSVVASLRGVFQRVVICEVRHIASPLRPGFVVILTLSFSPIGFPFMECPKLTN
jgi:hypothetical protein